MGATEGLPNLVLLRSQGSRIKTRLLDAGFEESSFKIGLLTEWIGSYVLAGCFCN